MTFKLLTAAAVLTAAIASPAVAMSPHARSEAAQERQHQARVYQYRPYYHGPYTAPTSGFWPADVAGAIVGGAIGTAGAIATAPLRYDAHAYNDYGPYPYIGLTCQPGTTFIGADGFRHICR